jgi:hypothetical protein
MIIGAFTLWGAYLLGRSFGLRDIYNDLFVSLLIVPISYYAFKTITPDLLMLCLLCFYLAEIFSDDYNTNYTKGIRCGLLGVLIYFAKYYGFPFFLVHYLFFNAIHLYRSETKEKKKAVFFNFISGMVIFLLLSGGWIQLLSQKYNHFTFSTQVKYNFGLGAPNSKGHPTHSAGIIKPVNNTAVSVWEDPSHLTVSEDEPFYFISKKKHFAHNFLRRLKKIFAYCHQFSYFSIAIISISILFVKIDASVFSNKIFYALFTSLIYCFGYALIIAEFRYFYVVYLLITLIGVLILDDIFPLLNKKTTITSVIFFTLIFSLIAYKPVIQIQKNVNVNKDIHLISDILKKEIPTNSNVASNNNWHKTLCISYLSGYQYYGETKEENINDSLMNDLTSNNIKYYFYWENNRPKDEDYTLSKTEKFIRILNREKVILEIIHIK